MKTDLRLALSNRFLIRLLLISAIMRLYFLFFYLPNKPSEFGPDEGTYGNLAKYVANSLPVQDFPSYGPGLYNSARTLIIPSSILIRMGLGQLDSVRFVSSFYGICSLLIFIMCVIAIQKINTKNENLGKVDLNNASKLTLIVYAFLPSYFLWSNLGLRESASQLFLVATFYLCIKLIYSKGFTRWNIIAITPIFLMLAFGSRPETALLFTICSLIFSIVLCLKVRNYSVAFVLSVGFIFGQAFTTTPTVQASEVLVATLVTEGKTSSPQTQINSKLSKKCKHKNEVLLEKSHKYVCLASKQYSIIERNPIKETQNGLLTTQKLEYKRNVNRLEASSALPESSCKFNFIGLLQKISCNLVELPYRLPSFLIRPFPVIDSGSSFQNLAGLENTVWLFLISLGVLRVIRKWKFLENRFTISFLFSFLICFSTAAALYEGNLGTAFRHKSTILWALLLILILTNNSTSLRKKDLSAFHK